MEKSACQTLKSFLHQFQTHDSLSEITQQLDSCTDSDRLIAIYDTAIPLIEDIIWQQEMDESLVKQYQGLFLEQEQLISSSQQPDTRHHIIIAIPVADRPEHLGDCLQSIVSLCEAYNYGGQHGGVYTKISVLIADDSQSSKNIQANRDLCEQFTHRGLLTEYFGIAEQQAIIHRAGEKSSNLEKIIGDFSDDHFFHKGASITRNITYLRLLQLSREHHKCLFYFIDSDQEFKIERPSDTGDQGLYAINYFYYLDRLFNTRNIQVLTGKVVGDPPVSPAVMCANIIDDINHFLNTLLLLDGKNECDFHKNNPHSADNASYHDMADLFGFKAEKKAFDYKCRLSGQHNNSDCLLGFSEKLGHFFDGEHPTRKSYYHHQNPIGSMTPARTIYTGNYVFSSEALKYFIPFARLRLRMAGPVMGRLIQKDIGKQFVSANLPMLHKRTLESIGQSEFRAGINRTSSQNIDLSGEFNRQFSGDIMLFSVIELTAMGYPQNPLNSKQILDVIKNITTEMQQKYHEKHQQIIEKTQQLKKLLATNTAWWNTNSDNQPAITHFKLFIDNIEHNFGEQAGIYKNIYSQDDMDKLQQNILDALLQYKNDMASWQTIMKNDF